jgi:hypothetical protein
MVIKELDSLQGRQFRAQTQLRDVLGQRETILVNLVVMKNAAEQVS